MERKALILLAALMGCFLAGCGSAETSATKEEQNRYVNPIKEPPPEAGNMSGPGGGAPGGAPPGSAPPPPPEGTQAPPG